MKRPAFINDPNVDAFVDWLSKNHSSIPLCLRLARSRFVPKGILASIVGIDNVIPTHYQWRAECMTTGDWAETSTHLGTLAAALNNSIHRKNANAALAACKDILSWGGNRNWSVGAWPFLTSLASRGALLTYLDGAANAFALSKADLSSLSSVTLMNSMLTKVHALVANDGLPIYDSRVAGAAACLVEMWRQTSGTTSSPLPVLLSFPAISSARSVSVLDPSAANPGLLAYGKPQTTQEWCSAKVRLGWIMEEVLKRSSMFSGGSSLPARMRMLEAALFVIGYDVRSLSAGPCLKPTSGKKSRTTKPVPPTEAVDLGRSPRVISTLFNSKGNISYTGSMEEGFAVRWGGSLFVLDATFLSELLSEFGGISVRLGASMTNPRTGSIGYWVENSPWPLRSRHASAIGAILSREGFVTPRREGRAAVLDFQ